MLRAVQNILIIGDSYSTYKGYIPEGYAVYYSDDDVEETWWHMLCREMNFNLVHNNSWSGSTIGGYGYEGDCTNTSAFICRLEKLVSDGFFEKNDIDTVFVFGGTNDSWLNSKMGEMKFSDFTPEDAYLVAPSISKLIFRLKEILPNGNIVFVLNTDMYPEIYEATKIASEHFGTLFITLEDIKKSGGHPTVEGMISTKNQIRDFIIKNIKGIE